MGSYRSRVRLPLPTSEFPFAVLMDATVIAISSLASFLIAEVVSSETIPDSSSNSSQNNVSSASSSTMPILARKCAAILRGKQRDS